MNSRRYEINTVGRIQKLHAISRLRKINAYVNTLNNGYYVGNQRGKRILDYVFL
jgi:hypothetical protein